jgi:hypothetical protein
MWNLSLWTTRINYSRLFRFRDGTNAPLTVTFYLLHITTTMKMEMSLNLC